MQSSCRLPVMPHSRKNHGAPQCASGAAKGPAFQPFHVFSHSSVDTCSYIFIPFHTFSYLVLPFPTLSYFFTPFHTFHTIPCFFIPFSIFSYLFTPFHTPLLIPFQTFSYLFLLFHTFSSCCGEKMCKSVCLAKKV